MLQVDKAPLLNKTRTILMAKREVDPRTMVFPGLNQTDSFLQNRSRMKKIVLLRHGQSELNAVWKEKAIFCGQIDTPLTNEGREQARNAGRLLADSSEFSFSHAVSSTLNRAVETLVLILQEFQTRPTLIAPVDAFNERSLGVFEGRTKQEVYSEHPAYRDDPSLRNFRDDYHQRAPGGENLTEVTLRAWPALEALLVAATGDLLVVAHCQVIRCLIAQALELDHQLATRLQIPHAVPLVLDVVSGSEPERQKFQSSRTFPAIIESLPEI
ncbi:MAG: histidine phosphatase family protein [Planctomycetaceae bacterium]